MLFQPLKLTDEIKKLRRFNWLVSYKMWIICNQRKVSVSLFLWKNIKDIVTKEVDRIKKWEGWFTCDNVLAWYGRRTAAFVCLLYIGYRSVDYFNSSVTVEWVGLYLCVQQLSDGEYRFLKLKSRCCATFFVFHFGCLEVFAEMLLKRQQDKER